MAGTLKCRLLGVGLGGWLLLLSGTGCGGDQNDVDPPTATDEGASEVSDDQPDLDQPKYTVIPGRGSASVEQAFEVSVEYVEDDKGQVWIDDDATNEGKYFQMAQGDTVEFGGWTFEAVYVSETLFHFTATSPDGQVFPD